MKVKLSDVIVQLFFWKGSIFGTLPIIGLMVKQASDLEKNKNIILPYVSTTRKNLGLGEEHMTLVVFDTFKGHKENEMDSLCAQ